VEIAALSEFAHFPEDLALLCRLWEMVPGPARDLGAVDIREEAR
jgi:hypothetical protein